MYHLDAHDQARFGIHEYDDEPESLYALDSFQAPDECDECKAWGCDPSDHAPECPYFEEMPLPF